MYYKICFTIKTKKETDIPIFRALPLPEDKQAPIEEICRTLFGKENERRKSDPSYNCHGLTFIGKLGWIHPQRVVESSLILPARLFIDQQRTDIEVIDIFLTENGYRRSARINNIRQYEFKGNEDIQLGDIAVYKLSLGESRETVSHTGIVVKLAENNGKIDGFKVLSKLGPCGEYVHPYNIYDEGFGTILEIWTDRDRQ